MTDARWGGTKITKDNVQRLFDQVEALGKADVYVGIPGDADQRKDLKEPPNHVLGYIHEFGEPSRNIPPRPFLLPGVRRARDQMVAALRQGARIALRLDGASGDAKTVARKALTRCGEIVASSARQVVQDGNFVPLSPNTVAERARKRIAIDWVSVRAWKKANPGQKVAFVNFVSDHPLLATGAMYQSITSVVIEK